MTKEIQERAAFSLAARKRRRTAVNVHGSQPPNPLIDMDGYRQSTTHQRGLTRAKSEQRHQQRITNPQPMKSSRMVRGKVASSKAPRPVAKQPVCTSVAVKQAKPAACPSPPPLTGRAHVRVTIEILSAREKAEAAVTEFFSNCRLKGHVEQQLGHLPSSRDLLPAFQTYAATVFDAEAAERLETATDSAEFMRELGLLVSRVVRDITRRPEGVWPKVVKTAAELVDLGSWSSAFGWYTKDNFMPAAMSLRALLHQRMTAWEKQVWMKKLAVGPATQSSFADLHELEPLASAMESSVPKVPLVSAKSSERAEPSTAVTGSLSTPVPLVTEASWLLQKMKDRNLTVGGVAALTGSDNRTIRNITEGGKLSRLMREKLSQGLGVPIGQIPTSLNMLPATFPEITNVPDPGPSFPTESPVLTSPNSRNSHSAAF